MSETSARALIERYFRAFNAGDHDGMLACVADDLTHDAEEQGREIGKDKFRWYLGMRARHFREQASDLVVMIAPGGGRAAAEFTLRGSYVSTRQGFPDANGQSYSLLAGVFFEIDDGLMSRITEYRDLAAWKAQLSRA
ncbi:hypothetical protein MesoLjLc_34750 [Mesorhizobium sp. L-8-10]|uniref:ketosteroid isomerase-related protein n=1 Tax=unclassified Mesorhizobium TaxID=325217 RepID=UPI0019279832|nr:MULTISPECIES: ketosteroid isomerase-related protein [unclassified Mesorhizobium]BCH23815.1 hypothetical protein MesoLjLb_36000 [Mesorhizobium sp. L-8-3]BCH31545.1 hypothetical protein MesoLjLc_34750 [Mesorhizobium sp. L-8-10]